MQQKNTVLIALSAVVLTSFASYQLGKRSTSAFQTQALIEQKVKTDLVNLTQEDFKEYQNLKSLEDRYKKADEILGKIVTVFLADLGLRLGYQVTNPAFLDASCAIPTTANNIAAGAPINSTSADANSSQFSKSGSSVTVAAAAPASNENWKSQETAFLEIRDEREALHELRKMEIPNLFNTLKSTEVISSKDITLVEGEFSGEITFFEDDKIKKAPWHIRLEAKLKTVTPVNAEYLCTLTNKANNKTFSKTNSSSGVLKDFTKAPGSKGLIVDVYGNDGYIQIYPLNGNSQTWVGNYYGRVSLDEFKLQGQVTLYKQQ